MRALLLTSCGGKFDRNLCEVKDVHYYYRDRMVKDLMNTHIYVGMTYDAVVGTLVSGFYLTGWKFRACFEISTR